MTLNLTSQSIQFGASASGTQKGGCFPRIIPNSTDELSDVSGDGSLTFARACSTANCCSCMSCVFSGNSIF